MRTLQNAGMAIAAAAMLLSGCFAPKYPPITDSPTGSYRTGQFVWRDLVTNDAEASGKFYSDVFGWEVTKDANAEGYFQVKNRGKLIGGIWQFPEPNIVAGNEWLSLVSVSSVKNTMDRVVRSGGSAMVEETAISGRGEVAIGVDDDGGIFGLIHSSTGDPAEEEPDTHEWLWQELWANNPQTAVSFYQQVGYTVDMEKDDDRDYWIIKAGNKLVGGIIENSVEASRSSWVPYIRVEDPAGIASRVERMGGKVIMAPMDDVRDGTLAICVDPMGAPFAIQKWDN